MKHKDHRHILGEKLVLSTISCSFCIRLFGTFQDSAYLYFALEFAPGGELFRRLGRKKSFPAAVAKFYASEVFVAIEHVQSLGIVYRDLKPENIMLDEDGHCKLVDFGFSRSTNSEGMLHTICGTPAYLSPEQLDSKFTNGYTKIVDWWSFGVLIYELLTGYTPFCKNNRETPYEIFLRILKNKIKFPRSFDSRSKELVSQLCHPQLVKRLVEPELIKSHSYFEVPWQDVAARRLVPPFVPTIKDEGDCHYFRNFSDPEHVIRTTNDFGAERPIGGEFFDF
jgi:protein kinase A